MAPATKNFANSSLSTEGVQRIIRNDFTRGKLSLNWSVVDSQRIQYFHRGDDDSTLVTVYYKMDRGGYRYKVEVEVSHYPASRSVDTYTLDAPTFISPGILDALQTAECLLFENDWIPRSETPCDASGSPDVSTTPATAAGPRRDLSRSGTPTPRQ